MFQSRTIRARTVVMLAVLLAHFLFLLLFDLSMRTIRTIDRMPITFLTFIKRPVERPHLDLKMDVGFKEARRAITVPRVTLNISSVTNSNSSVSRQIDWQAEARRTTRDYLKQHPEMANPIKEKSAPSLFPQPAPKPANIRLPGGKLIQWANSRCYVETVDGKLTDPTAIGKHLEPICIRPRPNEHMFDHLKPAYLRKPVEDICSKTMVGCNHSSSSSSH